MEEYTEKFDQVPLFEGLSGDEINDLLKISENVVAEPGQLIVRQGDPGDGFYVIGAGTFDVLKVGKHDEVLAHYEPLTFFGEMSLVTDDQRVASVVCTEEGRLKFFPKQRFNQLLDQGDLTAFKVVRNMCRVLAMRLAAADDRAVG